MNGLECRSCGNTTNWNTLIVDSDGVRATCGGCGATFTDSEASSNGTIQIGTLTTGGQAAFGDGNTGERWARDTEREAYRPGATGDDGTGRVFHGPVVFGDNSHAYGPGAQAFGRGSQAFDTTPPTAPQPRPAPTARHDDEAAWRQRQRDGDALDRALDLDEDDESPRARRIRAAAEEIAEQRRRAHADAVAAGTTPCPAAWSRTTPCVHPGGDGHDGDCFSADEGGGWARASSWFTPEARQQSRRGTTPEGRASDSSAPAATPTPARPAPRPPVEHAPAAPPAAPAAPAVDGEVSGHDSAKRYADAMAQAADAAVASLERTVAAMSRGRVAGPALDHLIRAREQATQMAATLRRALGVLSSHDVVREGYAAAPDAGDKDWTTGD